LLRISAAGSRFAHARKRLNFIGDALRDYLDPRPRIEAGL
jgi:hypothetical protein